MLGLTHALLFLAQTAPTGMPWWQIATGVLAIPTALLGLVYTYRLYLKTHLEMRKLELEIIEKEKQLGIPPVKTSKTQINFDLKQAFEIERSVIRSNIVFIISILFSIGFAWILPRPYALNELNGSLLWAARGGMIFILGLTVFFSYKYLKGKNPWLISAVAVTAFLLTILSVFSFLYVHSQYVVNYPPGETDIEIVTGTTLTETAKEYFRIHPTRSNSELMADFGGIQNIDHIWTAESITYVRVLLFVLYIISVILASVLLLSIVYLILLLRIRSKPISASNDDLLVKLSRLLTHKRL